MTVKYLVDNKEIKHFKTAVKYFLKTNAQLLIRIEVRYKLQRHSVLARNGLFLYQYLPKVRKQLVVAMTKNIDKKTVNFVRKVKKSKYQRRIRIQNYVDNFNKKDTQLQYRTLDYFWLRRTFKFSSGTPTSISDIRLDMENKGCVFK